MEEAPSTIPKYTSWCSKTACRCIKGEDKTDSFGYKRPKKPPTQKSDQNTVLRSTLWHCLSCRFRLGDLFFQEAEPPITYRVRNWSDCSPLCHPWGAQAAQPLCQDSECHNYLAATQQKARKLNPVSNENLCPAVPLRRIAPSRWGSTLCVPC